VDRTSLLDPIGVIVDKATLLRRDTRHPGLRSDTGYLAEVDDLLTAVAQFWLKAFQAAGTEQEALVERTKVLRSVLAEAKGER